MPDAYYVSKKVELPYVHHHAYAVAGVDKSVLYKQAVRRRDDYRGGETTIVHNHPYKMFDKVLGCNEKCVIFEPGYKIRSVAEERVKEDDDGTSGSS